MPYTKRSEMYERQRDERRRRTRRQIVLVTLLAVMVCFIFVILGAWISKGQEPEEQPTTVAETAEPAFTISCLEDVVLPDDVPAINVQYTGFRVSFNPVHHIPNYSAWELIGAETEGEVPRYSKFAADPDVYGCPSSSDYSHSGYDRGHMAPAADMKWSEQAMIDSHYMTNVCPQNHVLNSGRWSTLEKKCRQWAQRDSSLVIICGPVLTDDLPTAIGSCGVTVPARFFKVIMAPYNNPPSAIAFVMPNSGNVDQLEALVHSVDDVEAITGYDFFACLPDSIENAIEAESDYKYWNRRLRYPERAKVGVR